MTARTNCFSLRSNVGVALANALSAAARLALLCSSFGARLRDRRLRVGVVESCDDLIALDALAFFDADRDDLAGDLGGHRGLPPSDDIARRVENGARRSGAVSDTGSATATWIGTARGNQT